MHDVMISVHMLSYNHVDTIARAIEGVINQKTKYSFELIIGDDSSTDGTAEIVKYYASKYPEIIKAVCRQENIGAAENNADTLRKCRGKYIAVCEGDDEWIDNSKLDNQVNFLEEHTDYSMCVTKCIYRENGIDRKYPFSDKDINSLCDMFENGMVKRYATCTYVFRNVYINNPELIEYFRSGVIGDIISQTIMARTGKIHFIDKETAIYNRITNNNSSFSACALENQVGMIKTASRICNELTYFKYSREWIAFGASYDVAYFWSICEKKGMLLAFLHIIKSCSFRELVYFERRIIKDYLRQKQIMK